LKTTSAIKVATTKITADFCFEYGSYHVQNQHFAVSKDEWDAKYGTGTV